MSSWPGKFVIGLTGNIATGKSLVRRMLEHLGAYGIDADALSHKVIKRGTQGYQQVVDEFGYGILGIDGEINRVALAKVVFGDPQELQHLEAIIHPLVGEEINTIISIVDSKTVVIEAIKLIESGIYEHCDTLWVTCSKPELQAARLVSSRGMDLDEAYQRINVQPLQELKINQADQVIENNGSVHELWTQVLTAWKATFPEKQIPENLMEYKL
jgi:dephospho-CoA kinase